MDDESAPTTGACPHVNLDDHRCASRFCLGRLNQAFNVCFGAYRACPMFHRINAEIAEAQHALEEPAVPLVVITANGHQLPLRATGS
ncbi:MAG: hypothetical protein AAF432_07005 [Planctomycetota bacterium]